MAEVYGLIDGSALVRDFALADQMKRAAISTMNNIAEGFDSASRVEFRRFLRYAGRSASEVQSCLYVALDRHYVPQPAFARIYGEAESVRRLCAALSRRLSGYSSGSGRQSDRVREATAAYVGHCPTATVRPAHWRTGAPAYRRSKLQIQ